MRSRMTPEQLAKVKGKAASGNELHQLASTANGFGVTRAAKEKADADLVKQVGKRKAERLKEDAAQRAGAAPKGLRKWLG